MSRLLTSAFILLFLYGCASAGGTTVTTVSTVFYSDDLDNEASLIVLPAELYRASSLEFASKQRMLEQGFIRSGFKIATSMEEADYVAFVSYGIDNGTSKSTSVPLFGQTGGGSTYTTGTVNSSSGSGTYSASSYTMPTFGVVGSTSVTRTSYKRNIAIDLIRLETLASENPISVMEIRAVSRGRCGIIESVFSEMVYGIFSPDFPYENGVPTSRTESSPKVTPSNC